MKFNEQKSLMQRGPVESLPDVEVEGGILLVGDTAIATWEEGHSSYGYDSVKLFPAHYKGERAWLLYRSWSPARGYCASGEEEEILPFEEGVALFIKKGKFDFFEQ